MSTITIALPDEILASLRELAAERGISPEDLAREGVEDLVRRRREEFHKAADYVLEKNAELYRRLAR